MKLVYTTATKIKTIAENYTPDNLPPRAILSDWLKQTGETLMTVGDLQTKLKFGLGRPFMFGFPQGVMEWQDDTTSPLDTP